MAENYSLDGGSSKKPTVTKSAKVQKAQAAGILMDRRVQIGVIVVAMLAVLISTAYSTGKIGGAGSAPGAATLHTRQKNHQEASDQPDALQPGAGQNPQPGNQNQGD